MGTIKINKNNNETNKDKTKLELFIEKQSALQNNGAAVQTAKEAEPTALSAATAVATKGLSSVLQYILPRMSATLTKVCLKLIGIHLAAENIGQKSI